MEQIILVVHLLVALAIIGLIMLQQGKGADIGASFGAGASQTLFGSTGSGNVLSRATGWLVAAFFATSFGLAMLANNQTASVEDLGFELPEEVVSTPATNMQESEIPMGDSEIPVVESPAQAEVMASDADVPAVAVPESDAEVPQGN